MPLRRFLEKFQCGFLVAPLRHKAFEHFALVVDGPPQVMQFTANLHKNLVHVPPPVARPHSRNPTFPDFRSKHRPEPNRFMADVNAPLMQQILHVAEQQWKTDVHHHRQPNDLGRGFEVSEVAAFYHAMMLCGGPAILKPFCSDSAVAWGGVGGCFLLGLAARLPLVEAADEAGFA